MEFLLESVADAEPQVLTVPLSQIDAIQRDVGGGEDVLWVSKRKITFLGAEKDDGLPGFPKVQCTHTSSKYHLISLVNRTFVFFDLRGPLRIPSMSVHPTRQNASKTQHRLFFEKERVQEYQI